MVQSLNREDVSSDRTFNDVLICDVTDWSLLSRERSFPPPVAPRWAGVDASCVFMFSRIGLINFSLSGVDR